MTKRDAQWLTRFSYDPRPALVGSDDGSIALFARRDLNGERLSVEDLWQSRESQRIVNKQRSNGSWNYPTKRRGSAPDNYDQYETFKNLATLVEKFGFSAKHPAIRKAAEYFFSHQSDQGDLRGIYDKQYSPNYTAAIAELLIKAGYQDDPRIERVFEWLLASRQRDGGWALPFRTRGYNIDVTYAHPTTIEPDISKPCSHMVTGVVLRAFAAHPRYRTGKEAEAAGGLLRNSLFKKDNYPDRGSKKYWLQFTFPFCYTDLISSLDSLSWLGFPSQDPLIDSALRWFADNQAKDGILELRVTAGKDRAVTRLWLTLAVCRIFKRFYG